MAKAPQAKTEDAAKMDAAERTVADKQKEVENLQAQLTEKDAELTKVKEDRDGLARQLATMQDGSVPKQVAENEDALVAENNRLRTEVGTLRDQVKSLQKRSERAESAHGTIDGLKAPY